MLWKEVLCSHKFKWVLAIAAEKVTWCLHIKVLIIICCLPPREVSCMTRRRSLLAGREIRLPSCFLGTVSRWYSESSVRTH